VECQLLLSRDLGYLGSSAWTVLDEQSQDLARMLTGLIQSLGRAKTRYP
jgi:hypothetical protein